MTRLDACGAEPALVSLCKRCLARVPGSRPRNAGDVAKAVAGLRAEAEDRAKQAELDRAAALVKAAEQRKRRKVQAALGLSFTALVVLVGAFAWWQDRQATERLTEQTRLQGERAAERAAVEGRAQQAVDSGVTLAAELRDKFRFAEAAVTLDQADAIIPPDTSPQIRDRLAAARKDLTFVRQLDEIRTSRVRSDFYAGQAGIQLSYPAAFRDIGIDPTGPDSAAIGDRVAASPIKQHLVIALDDWSWNESDTTTRARLLAVVRRADPGPWSDRLRDSAVRAQPAALDRLAAEANPDSVPPNLVVLLFQIRPRAWADGPKLLASAVSRYPNDFWVLFEAGYYYYSKDYRPSVAAGYLRAAYTIRPDLPLVRQLVLECMIRAGQEVEATAELQEMIRRDPKTAWSHAELAKVLRRNDLQGAIVELKEAIRLDPKNAWFHSELAWTLRISDPEGAIAEYKEAIRLRPTVANFHADLAQVLRTTNPEAAIAEFKEALRLNPNHGSAKADLANALKFKAERDAKTAPPPREVKR
jgi:tetratricopeptide (TPR) repeat protein